MQKLQVTVTQEHIDKGEIYARDRCAFALALKDSVADCDSAEVFGSTVLISSNGVISHYDGGSPLDDFVYGFDSGDWVKPQIIEIVKFGEYKMAGFDRMQFLKDITCNTV